MPLLPTPSNYKLRDFLWNLLKDTTNNGMIEWIDEDNLEFRIIDQHAVCEKWTVMHNTTPMDYSKLSRCIRHCYTCNLMKKGNGKFRYQFVHPDNVPSIINQSLKRKATTETEGQPEAKRNQETINNYEEEVVGQQPINNGFTQMCQTYMMMMMILTASQNQQ